VEKPKAKPETAKIKRLDNKTQFIQRRILERIQKISEYKDVAPKITCFECDEIMSIIATNEESSLARCNVCNHSTLVRW